ncbi:LysR family transcriptional regulator [Amycolatopsis rubida]|uniref:DNA-binding transcriptional regulator, LysR family n=1 Tax=Amycolatopsis rubida TaxID=112413 RepID=A0A1I5L930_9PSEU|nr:LysR family transcriptional regulator [Amycolatopsis rubida]SFO93728.1 DNA-binding transcriptional regulator, LysR family [Amycolatopsis rubida]
MEIDFTRLKYFVAVADELHFKRASDRLRITPPPLSKQIKLLERELGGPLFERHYHEVRLTPLGQALLGPARAILRQVEGLKDIAAGVLEDGTPIRVGATAYAPSDLLEDLETAVGGLAAPATFEVAGSAAEVTAKLVSGHLELGLIHLAVEDQRLRARTVAEYQGAIAVRADDPLACRDLVRIEELRDREVVIDFARPNPVILAALTRKLASRGVRNIVRAVSGRGGELEMAAQVFNRRLVALVSYAPASFIGRMFSPPEFQLVRIEEDGWEPSRLALAWAADRAAGPPRPADLAEALSAKLGPIRRG